jgi:phage/plasmid-associated DNA primase
VVLTDTHVNDTIRMYNDVMMRLIGNSAALVRDSPELFYCVVLTKPSRVVVKDGESLLKTGFHLHWPNMFFSIADAQLFVQMEVRKEATLRQPYADVVKTSQAHVDDPSTKQWLMYGSCKERGASGYRFERMVAHTLVDVSLEAHMLDMIPEPVLQQLANDTRDVVAHTAADLLLPDDARTGGIGAGGRRDHTGRMVTSSSSSSCGLSTSSRASASSSSSSLSPAFAVRDLRATLDVMQRQYPAVTQAMNLQGLDTLDLALALNASCGIDDPTVLRCGMTLLTRAMVSLESSSVRPEAVAARAAATQALLPLMLSLSPTGRAVQRGRSVFNPATVAVSCRLRNDTGMYDVVTSFANLSTTNMSLEELRVNAAALRIGGDSAGVAAAEAINNIDPERFNADMSAMQRIVPRLPDVLADSYNTWFRVGSIVYSLSIGSAEGLEMWIEFSRRSPRHGGPANAEDVARACAVKWRRIKAINVNIGSLWAMLRDADNAAYMDVKRDDLNMLAMSDKHTDVAEVLHKHFSDTYVFSQESWWHFVDHRWRNVDKGMCLRRSITSTLPIYYNTRMASANASEVSSQAGAGVGGAGSLANQMGAADQMNRLRKLQGHLKTCTFKNAIMTEARELFNFHNFASKLDMRTDLLPCENGVYDFNTHTFRAGRPDDMISNSTGVTYDASMTTTHKDVRDVKRVFRHTYPDKDVRLFTKCVFADALLGINRYKKAYFLIGSGDNGKSGMQALIEKALGPLAVKLPTTVLTGKRTQSSSATPELALLGNGVRFAFLQEPGPYDEINVGVFKEATGQDSLYVRELFKAPRIIDPMFTLFLTCNNRLNAKLDNATSKRCVLIPHQAYFSETAPTDPEEQMARRIFPRDPEFIKHKTTQLAPATLWYLLHILRKHGNRPYALPREVFLATEDFRRMNDPTKRFLHSLVEEVDPPAADETDAVTGLPKVSERILMRDLWIRYKEWPRPDNAGADDDEEPADGAPAGGGRRRNAMLKESQLKTYLNNLWGKPANTRLSGLFWRNRRLLSMTEMRNTETEYAYTVNGVNVDGVEEMDDDDEDVAPPPPTSRKRAQPSDGNTAGKRAVTSNDALS